jgi:hypothetical protein
VSCRSESQHCVAALCRSELPTHCCDSPLRRSAVDHCGDALCISVADAVLLLTAGTHCSGELMQHTAVTHCTHCCESLLPLTHRCGSLLTVESVVLVIRRGEHSTESQSVATASGSSESQQSTDSLAPLRGLTVATSCGN